MLFHTWTFLLFLAVFWPVWILVRRTRLRELWLLAGSWTFYAWWNPIFLTLVIYSTVVDWVCVRAMARGGRRRLWLWVSLVNNLGLLGFFKYADFVTENANGLFAWLGLGTSLAAPDVLLPVGISFYTFQSLSYTIDYYRGEVEAEPSFVRFAAFVSLFPQLVAGPIERARDLLPQIARPFHVDVDDVAEGASLFLSGLVKKVVLADWFALYVDQVYAVPAGQSSTALLAATFLFAWQIYFDFSGYTDMARGIARVLGFRLTLNFRRPYLATDLGDFWRRWHVSLSTWFRDYVYIPLGGNRHGAWRTRLNIALTMVISGLWHGAAWTFVIWGAVHAAGRLATRPLERHPFWRDRVPGVIKQALTFATVGFAWIFFRAATLEDAFAVVRGIAALDFAPSGCPLAALAAAGAVWAWQAIEESRFRPALEGRPFRIGLATAQLVLLTVVPLSREQAFIYFQF